MYIDNFKQFAQTTLSESSSLRGLAGYTFNINERANELLAEASNDELIDQTQLQKELFKLGKKYINKFGKKHKFK